MNRRNFMGSALIAAALPPILKLTKEQKSFQMNKMTVGVIAGINNPDKDIQQVREFGFGCCQLSLDEVTPGYSQQLRQAFSKYDVKPVSMMCHGPGPYIYDFKDGPSTIGLVPRAYRTERIARLKKGIDFCRETGIPAIQAHFGFIPENPNDSLYKEFVELMKDMGDYALKRGIDIYFETGQETPVTLRRTIEDVGTGNLFVNYDTANLILYGKANPLDGLLVLGKYVKSFHAKDGKYPTDPYKLGEEVPIPDGLVNFPGIIAYLKKNDFQGSLIIENEMSSNTREYLVKTRNYLQGLIENT
jgi:L-ribulose-5-phosphate 3-epimerase